MPNIVADGLYPPLPLTPRWALSSLAILVLAVGGYWLIKFIRVKLALRAQRRLATLDKPHKAMIIARALQQIQELKAAVEAGRLTPDVGAERVSLVARSAFDAIMNHHTSFQAKYEVAARELHTMLAMLDVSYPAEFAPSPPTGHFNAVCEQAVKVVQSCS